MCKVLYVYLDRARVCGTLYACGTAAAIATATAALTHRFRIPLDRYVYTRRRRDADNIYI